MPLVLITLLCLIYSTKYQRPIIIAHILNPKSSKLKLLILFPLDSDSDSENEESKANRSWLKAYINETKHHRNDLMEKVEMECKDDNFGNNLRELFILQDDNSKDEELQELLTKFHDCLGLVE